jgi:hypothetical protein
MSNEEILAVICDKYCRMPYTLEEDELEICCQECPLNCLTEGISDKKEQALKLMEHIKDRPCEACEFKQEGNCTKWTCVFDAWLYKYVYSRSMVEPQERGE